MTIKITCDGCGKVHDVRRTSEVPDWVVSMGCNWCPDCEDSADELYDEWYNGSEENGSPEPINPNQLVLPFEIEHIEHNTLKEKETV